MHAAGAARRDVPIRSLQRSDCEEQFRPRLQGLRTLEKVLHDRSLDFCVVHSSLAAVMGVLGFVSYTAAHLFMDAYVHRHNREARTPWRTINWDTWNFGIPSAESRTPADTAFPKMAFYMTPAESTDVLSRLLSMTDATQALVSSADLQGRIDQWIRREKPQADETQEERAPTWHAHPRPALSSQYEAPRNDAERLLADIWRKMLGIDQVGIHDDFFELGGDSLMIVRLISEINRTHKVSLGVAELFRNPTVKQMARLIDGRQPESKRQPAVVELQKGRVELPVYFMYAGPDEFRLAQLMDERHPVFGIEVPWLLSWRNAVAANRRSAFPTLEQLVAPYVAALSAHTRSSPCVLAGHSFAGVIAFEAAHQIRKQGGQVELVVLFDTWAKLPNPYLVTWHQWRQDWKQATIAGSTERLSPSIGSRLRRTWRITRWLLGQERNRIRSFFKRDVLDLDELIHMLDEQGMPLPGGLLDRLYRNLEKSYRPRPLDSRGILFTTDSSDAEKAVRAFDGSLGWKNLFTRGLEIIPMIGDHLSMIREHNSTLAREMDEVLKRHWSSLPDKVGDVHAPRRVAPGPETLAMASLDFPDG